MRNLRISLFAALVVAYVATRLWHLTDSCLWFDEIYGVHAAEHSWSALLRFVALDLVHPPLFYLMLKLWVGVGGETLLWLRLVPACLSVAAVVPFHLLSRELNGQRFTWAELLSLLFLTVNGSWLKYSQEVRMYSLLMCLGVTSLWLFVRWANRTSGFWWLGAVNILLVWSHYFGWFVVGSEIIAVLVLQRDKWRQVVLMGGVVAVTFAPWLVTVLSIGSSDGLNQNIGWMPRPGLGAVGSLLLQMVEPFYYSVSSLDPSSVYKVSIPILAVVLTALVMGVVAGTEERTVRLLLLLVATPIVGALILSWVTPYSIWGARHLVIVVAPAAIISGKVIMSLKANMVRLAFACFVILLIGYAGIAWASRPTPLYSWCAWGDLATASADAGAEKLYVTEDLSAYHSWFALRDRGQIRVVKLAGIDGIAEDAAYFLPRGFDAVGNADIAKVEDPAVWLAFRTRLYNEGESPLRNFLLRGYRIVDKSKIGANAEDVYLVKLEK